MLVKRNKLIRLDSEKKARSKIFPPDSLNLNPNKLAQISEPPPKFGKFPTAQPRIVQTCNCIFRKISTPSIRRCNYFLGKMPGSLIK